MNLDDLRMMSGVAWIFLFWVLVILAALVLYNKFFRKR